MNEMEEFKTSDKLEEFTKAFSKFQSMHLSVKKDATNPHFRSTYASLPAVLETCRDSLALTGLSVLQLPLGGVEVSRLLNRITHSSGQFIQWVYTTPITKKDPQGIGSAITYSRRYSLTSSLGLPEVDDDGNNAAAPQGVHVPEENKSYNDAPKKTYRDSDALSTGAWIMNENQRKRLFAITKANGYEISDVDSYIKASWGYVSTKQLTKAQYDLICGTAKAGEKPNGLLPTRTLRVENFAPPVTNDHYPPMRDEDVPF